MADKYVVYVFAPPAGEAQAAGEKLAQLLRLEPAKVGGLMRRLPGLVTRPVSEREAKVAAQRFADAGFTAQIRHEDGTVAQFGPAAPGAEPEAEVDPFVTSTPEAPGSGPTWADQDDEFPASSQEGAAGPSTFGSSGAFSSAGDGLGQPEVGRPRHRPQPAAASDTAPDGVRDRVPDGVPPAPAAGTAPSTIPSFVPEAGADPAQLAREKLASARAAADEAAAAVAAAPSAAAASTAAATSTAASVAGTAATAATAVSPTAAAPRAERRPARARRSERAAAPADASPRRRGSLRSKLLSTAIIPVLLTIAGALAATWFTARPALYDQLLESARNPAIATAATLSSTLERAGGDEIDHLQLLETILITRQAFARQNLSFILATDTSGNPYSGSFLGGSSFPEESLALQNAVRERAVHAVQQGAAGRSGWAEEGATSNVEAAGGQRIEIVAQPLMSGDRPVGAVVVGVTDQAVTAQVNRIVINVLLFSLIPLLLAIFIAAVRARRLTNNVLTLTRKADEISRGDLDEPVALRSNDELDDLSAALERMRVSMSGALERLRRRR